MSQDTSSRKEEKTAAHRAANHRQIGEFLHHELVNSIVKDSVLGDMAKKRSLTVDEESENEKPQRKTTKRSKKSDGSNTEEESPQETGTITVEKECQPLPTRSKDAILHFKDFPEFKPNLTPKEVLQAGSFGGTYFRNIRSSITNQSYRDMWKELPSDWLENLDIKRKVASQVYDTEVNTYKASCGGDLKMWEESGWITSIDPYGWFQWYCRFYQGRRCSDDERQIGRALGVMGPTGRWRRNLMNKCLQSISPKRPIEKVVDDASISPKIRQLLQVSSTDNYFPCKKVNDLLISI
jgi:hypothetical protein